MAEDTTDNGPATGAAAGGKRSPALLLAVGGGLLLGVLAGIYFIAPRLRHAPAPATAAAPAPEAASAPVPAAPPVIYTIDNLVLNPAQTAGTRFLMLAVALELSGAESEAAVKARDSEVRDTVLRVLADRTVAQLSDVAQRDTLKAQLQAAVGAKFGPGVVRRVYFPQFVIQ